MVWLNSFIYLLYLFNNFFVIRFWLKNFTFFWYLNIISNLNLLFLLTNYGKIRSLNFRLRSQLGRNIDFLRFHWYQSQLLKQMLNRFNASVEAESASYRVKDSMHFSRFVIAFLIIKNHESFQAPVGTLGQMRRLEKLNSFVFNIIIREDPVIVYTYRAYYK